jgi:hypothetical protein
MTRFVGLCALVLAMFVSSIAAARTVYLNGVKLDDNVILNNQTFAACEVKFDDKGDVYITAKGFKIGVQDASNDTKKDDPPAADGKLGKRYWLVTQQTKLGVVQYDVDVFVNGKFVKKVRSSEDRVVMEITKWVQTGSNKVRLQATKNMGDKRASTSPADTLEIIIGEGTVGGGTVAIDKPVVDWKRTAQETKNITEEVSFTGR